jgi:hypothetical protein
MSEHPSHERRALQLDVSAWSIVQPTRLLSGATVELGGDGALLRLPGLAPEAVQLDLRIALPERALHGSVKILRRQPPDLVEVSFETIDAYERARLIAFVRTAAVDE